MTQIIEKVAELKTAIKKTIDAYNENGFDLHVVFVSCLWQAAKHGNTTPLNSFVSGLRTNDATAAKAFIRRSSIINGYVVDGDESTIDGRPAEENNTALAKGSVVTFEKKTWNMIPGWKQNPASENMVKLIEARFIAPDGEEDKPFLYRNNFAEHKTLGDVEVIKKILSSMALESSEKKTIDVTPKVKTIIEGMKDQLKQLQSQVSLTEPSAH